MTTKQAARWLIDYPHGPSAPTKLKQWIEATMTPGAQKLAEQICPDYRGTFPTAVAAARARGE